MYSGSGRHYKTESEGHILKSGEAISIQRAGGTERPRSECPECKKMGTRISTLYQQVIDVLALESKIKKGYDMS